jgi:hypothetical protein
LGNIFKPHVGYSQFEPVPWVIEKPGFSYPHCAELYRARAATECSFPARVAGTEESISTNSHPVERLPDCIYPIAATT